MYYKAIKAKYIVGIITWTPIKADGSRDTHSFIEIYKAENRGDAELICYMLNEKALTADGDNNFISKYVVISVEEAKRYKEAAV